MAARTMMVDQRTVCLPYGLLYNPSMVAVAHIEDQPNTCPFRRLDLGTGAGSRMDPGGDEFAIDECSDELCKGRDRRVPRVLHRERNGYGLLRRGRGERPPGKSLWRVQRPLEVAEHPGAAARGEELRCMVVGDGLAIALYRFDLDHPRQELRVQRLRWWLGSHGIHARSSMTSATPSPLQ